MTSKQPIEPWHGMLELHLKSKTDYWLECSHCPASLFADDCPDGTVLKHAHGLGWRAVEGKCYCPDCVPKESP